jgi:DNA polymerase bacteriophage-type
VRTAHIDYETFSCLDLTKVGAYRYAEDESTEILMCSYYRDEWPEVKIWVPAEGQPMPADLADIFTDHETLIVAWNASFERQITYSCLPQFDVPIFRWRCAMVSAMSIGFPGKLEQAGPAIGLPEDLFKQEGGRKLINKFCKPRKPSKKNPDTRWTRHTAPEEWALFKQYCLQDTRAETAIWDKLHAWRMPAEEQRLWEIDQAMNDRGVQVDVELALAAHTMGLMHRARLVEKAQALTSLANPNSVQQLMAWLNDQPDFDPDEETDVEDLRKKTVEKILGRDDLGDVVRKVLELRQQIAKSSLKKYDTILRATCSDGRIRGTMQFGGANRTMRWAGRLLQVQNLPQGMIEDLELLSIARDLVRLGEYEALCILFGEDQIPNVLATLIRTCLIAGPGKRLIVADLSAIEARVTAWFAKCMWRLEVFRTHGMIYEASASQMFGIPLTEFKEYKKATGKHHPARKKGKVSELALGYQGAVNALITMGALEMGLQLEELQPMVDAWRLANPEIAGTIPPGEKWPQDGLWRDVENAAKKCIRTKSRQEVAGCIFRMAGGNMVITLPSGRHMHYVRAHLARKDGKQQIAYWGTDQKTKRWGLLYTYGGKLCIAKDTPVLTRRGWVPIQNVVPFEEVWDGVEWVRQGGVAVKGEKETIKAHGVRMTPDHEVLTEKGWRHASQSEGHNRAPCRLPDGYEVHRVGRQEIDLGSNLRLRDGRLVTGNGVAKAIEARGDFLVWLHAQGLHQGPPDAARDVFAPRLRSLAEHARPVLSSDPPSVGELRWPRDNSLRSVESLLPGVLGGHGADLRARLDYRPGGQRAGLFPRELPLGNVQAASQQSPQLSACTGTVGADHRSRSGAPPRDLSFDFALQSEEVFDLINCGPRHRFVVADENGQPLIVHNCENIVQAFSRDILREILFELDDLGYHPIMLVHDEGVLEEDIGHGSLNEVLGAMGHEVSYAPGLPLKGAGFENHFYYKD